MKKFKLGFLILFTTLALFSLNRELIALPMYQINDVTNSTPGFNGGPFLITPLSGGPSFDTFCLEYTEYFNLGGKYYGTIEPYAIAGGGGAVNNQDPVDEKTKHLYSFYLDNKASLSANDWTALQLAIWKIEDEITSFTGYSAEIQNLAQNYFANALTIWGITHDIQALNLWGDEGLTQKKQSQLIAVPEPSTLLLLGVGLIGLGILGRKKFRTKP